MTRPALTLAGMSFAIALTDEQWELVADLFDEIDGLARVRDALDGDLGAELGALLSRAEVRATRRRVAELLADGSFPMPSATWPAIPWPAF